MTQSADDGGSGAILIQTISDGKQANILQASRDSSLNNLDERLKLIERSRDENDVEEPNDEEPEICECCGQIIK